MSRPERRCSECDAPVSFRHRLNDDGVCAWRFGCEHRQYQSKVLSEKVLTRLAEVGAPPQRKPEIEPGYFREYFAGGARRSTWGDKWT